jgi:nicotinamide mononucleotide (NMN) deamidase PncC
MGQGRPHLVGRAAPARPAAPVGLAGPGGSAMPSTCGTFFSTNFGGDPHSTKTHFRNKRTRARVLTKVLAEII